MLSSARSGGTSDGGAGGGGAVEGAALRARVALAVVGHSKIPGGPRAFTRGGLTRHGVGMPTVIGAERGPLPAHQPIRLNLCLKTEFIDVTSCHAGPIRPGSYRPQYVETAKVSTIKCRGVERRPGGCYSPAGEYRNPSGNWVAHPGKARGERTVARGLRASRRNRSGILREDRARCPEHFPGDARADCDCAESRPRRAFRRSAEARWKHRTLSACARSVADSAAVQSPDPSGAVVSLGNSG